MLLVQLPASITPTYITYTNKWYISSATTYYMLNDIHSYPITNSSKVVQVGTCNPPPSYSLANEVQLVSEVVSGVGAHMHHKEIL